jgi:hypothetical protein
MADKDKKPSLGETVAILAIAAVLTAALYAIVTGLWKCATANRKRAWVCVPILLWPLVFVPVQIIGIILMSMTGLANFSELNPATPEQEFVNGVVTWSDVVIAFVISLLITRRVVRRIDEETIHLETIPPEPPEKTNPAIVVKEEADFSKPPYYRNPKKWFSDNFFEKTEMVDCGMRGWEPETFLYYKGPDLRKYGFNISYQKIRPGEKVKYRYTLEGDLEGEMNSWNCAMAYSEGKKPPRKKA